jgi:4-hydroxy-3-polyprenylbenzoate decarboxylase
MLRAHDAGAVIMPAMPAFYARAGSVDDLVTAFAGRILDLLGIENDLAPRWSES